MSGWRWESHSRSQTHIYSTRCLQSILSSESFFISKSNSWEIVHRIPSGLPIGRDYASLVRVDSCDSCSKKHLRKFAENLYWALSLSRGNSEGSFHGHSCSNQTKVYNCGDASCQCSDSTGKYNWTPSNFSTDLNWVLCFSFCEVPGFWGRWLSACFAWDISRGGSWWVAPIFFSLPSCELAPLFSPNQLLCLTLSYTKVSIRFPSYLPYRHFKRKRIVEDSLHDF